MGDRPGYTDHYDNECHHDQVRAVFNGTIYGVIAAIISATVLAYYLLRLNFASQYVELTWISYIVICASCHIVLCLASRSPTVKFTREGWRTRVFLVVCVAEGLGWGATPLLVYHSSNGTGELFTLIALCGLCSGSVVAFGPYLPAFIGFFVTSVAPIAIILTISSNATLNSAGLLTIIYFFGIGGLGIIFSRKFKENIILKINSNRIAHELKLQKDVVEKANLAKSQFLAAASHDLRQPIHAISLYIGALRNVRQALEADKIIDNIQRSIIDMDMLFSSILDISRLDAGAIKFHSKIFSINNIIERIVEHEKLEALSHGLELRQVRCGKSVDSDPIITERILRNLISNALRYTQSGRVLVGGRRCGETLRIEVWDTGCGIAAEHQERIFDEFYQVENLERDRTKGLGLGLAIVRRLTTLIHSELSLTSQVGKGSCFAFTLPIASADGEEEEDRAAFIADSRGSGLIAVVDDEVAIRDAMSEILQRWGYSVISAESGEELIRYLITTDICPDLMICDYRLRAGETGHDVISRVRSLFSRKIPAMLITGDTAPERIAEAQGGDALVLHKPVPNGKLRAAIISLMGQPAPSTALSTKIDPVMRPETASTL